MTIASTRFFFWAPRILCLLLAVFLSLFALDAFDEGGSIGRTVLAFLIHLFPAALVVLVLALSWRRELVGAIAFLALGLLYIVGMGIRLRWSASVVIAGPLFVVSALFLSNWALKRRGAIARPQD